MSKNVKKVVLTIDVKRKHILHGEPGKSDRCAIAMATREALSCGSMHVAAEASTLEIGSKVFPMPKSAQKFVAAFDAEVDADTDEETAKLMANRKKLKPFQLKLSISLCDLLT